ncbi:hypothetical protein E4T48_05494 [Aureobasidium sp. EXF-10727]|nr:hypothetical protein E4T48_05494 [Aureobasidium sp. EXF-10727]
MAPVRIESHASSKTPNTYIPPPDRLDLAMSKDVLKKAPVFSCAHLNYLECHRESVFVDDRSVNLLLNALRLHWKIKGNTLKNAADQGGDLYELLMLEVNGQRIISNLFTREALYVLLERKFPDAMMILAAIIHDIYLAQWHVWCDEQNQKHKQQSQYAQIIAHAQATSNQLSNNVLAFRGKVAPELRKWAEETVARHLLAIVTPGHLPFPATLSPTNNPIPDLLSNNTTRFDYDGNNRKASHASAQGGSSNDYYRVPFRPATKRKSPRSHSSYHTLPPVKRMKIENERTGHPRPRDLYRPSGFKRPTYHNGHGRLGHTISSPNTHAHATTHEEHRRAKLQEVQAKLDAAQKKADIISYDLAVPDANSNLNSAQEHDTLVFNSPSYADYLRKKKQDAESLLPVNKALTASHVRNKSDVGSEEGEIYE